MVVRPYLRGEAYHCITILLTLAIAMSLMRWLIECIELCTAERSDSVRCTREAVMLRMCSLSVGCVSDVCVTFRIDPVADARRTLPRVG